MKKELVLRSLALALLALVIVACNMSKQIIPPDPKISYTRVTDMATSADGLTIYAAGFAYSDQHKTFPGYWKNGVWNALEKPSDMVAVDFQSIHMAVSGNDIYISATYKINNESATQYKTGYWKNATWVDLPSDSSGKHAKVNEIAINGANVYAAGYRTKLNGSFAITIPGYWKDGTWVALPPAGANLEAQVTSITTDSSGNVYAGGYCKNSSNVSIPGYWYNGTWYALENLKNINKDAKVDSIIHDGTNLYAGGYCVDNTDYKVPGYWSVTNPHKPDGAGGYTYTWKDLAGTINATNSMYAIGIAKSGGKVYRTGLKLASPLRTPGYWTDGTFTALTMPNGHKFSAITSLAVNGTNVYVGGSYNDANNVEVPGYWKNGFLTSLPDPSVK